MTVHSRSLPAAGGNPSRTRKTGRLPWWAVAPPTAAFFLLLAVLARTGHPAGGGIPPSAYAGHLLDLLPRALATLL